MVKELISLLDNDVQWSIVSWPICIRHTKIDHPMLVSQYHPTLLLLASVTAYLMKLVWS
jgi:hypothetical protein